MTPKEKAFCDAILRGESKSEAYRIAYSPRGDQKGIASAAWKVSNRPHVIAYLERHQTAADRVETFTAAHRRAFVIRGLMREANGAEQAGARVRALELLGKMHDVRLFTDAIDAADASRSPAQVMSELRARLSRIAGDVVDVTPEKPDGSDT